MKLIRSSRPFVSFILGIALIATSLAQASAQQSGAPKRALTHKDYDTWHSIQSPQISRDGKFIAYAYMAQDADSEIVVRNVSSGNEWRAARGEWLPAPPPADSYPKFTALTFRPALFARPAVS